MQADLFKNLIHSVLHPTEEGMAALVPASCSTEDSRTVEARQEARMGRQLDKAGGAVALPQTWQQHSSRGRLFCHLQEHCLKIRCRGAPNLLPHCYVSCSNQMASLL